MALLQARDLTKTFGQVRALDAVSFDIDEGITGLLGSNGAGKSTSLKLFLGLLDPDGGTAEVLGVDPRTSAEYRTRVGYAPEHDCLPRNVSAAEFLAYMARISGLPPTAARLRASDVLRHVGLFEERYRAMGTYSTGMKQRVKLAQALVHDPVVAFLDEPTAGLDPLGRREMLDLVRRVGSEFGISIVISTHLMGDVERVCDSVVVLDAGRLLRAGPVSGFTEETETLEVELLEGVGAVADGLRRRGLEPLVDGSRLTLESVSGADYDTLRDVIVESGRPPVPARPGAALARGRLRVGAAGRPARGGGRVVTSRPAEVFDLGYQRYEGERTGRWDRRRAIWSDGIRISLGLGRGTGAKIAPWLLLGLALVPILILVVVSAFVGAPQNPDDFELPSYGDYYDWAMVPLGLFAAVVAPLLVCPDRRDRVLTLYAARPITPLDYVGARWAAFLTVSLAAAWLPEAILFAWNVLDAEQPGSFLVDNWDVVPRFLAAGATVAAVLTTLALFVSSFATRRAYASVAILAVLFIGSAIGGIAEDNFTGSRLGRALAREHPAGAQRRRPLDLRRPASSGRCPGTCRCSGSSGSPSRSPRC